MKGRPFTIALLLAICNVCTATVIIKVNNREQGLSACILLSSPSLVSDLLAAKLILSKTLQTGNYTLSPLPDLPAGTFSTALSPMVWKLSQLDSMAKDQDCTVYRFIYHDQNEDCVKLKHHDTCS